VAQIPDVIKTGPVSDIRSQLIQCRFRAQTTNWNQGAFGPFDRSCDQFLSQQSISKPDIRGCPAKSVFDLPQCHSLRRRLLSLELERLRQADN
jgi:hypothetical protein